MSSVPSTIKWPEVKPINSNNIVPTLKFMSMGNMQKVNRNYWAILASLQITSYALGV